MGIGDIATAIADWWRGGPRKEASRSKRTNSFELLRQDLWSRATAPLLNFTYWTHLIIGVCFYGAIGIWAEWLRKNLLGAAHGWDGIVLAMHATYPAIIGATGMQLLLNKNEQTYVRSFAQLVSTVFFTVAAVCVIAADKIGVVVSFRIGEAGLLAAMLFWWVANGTDEDLKDLDPEAMTGGPLPSPTDIAPKPAVADGVDTAMGHLKL